MEIEYIGELLPDGHLSVDPIVLSKIPKNERVKVTIVPLSKDKTVQNQMKDPATKRFLKRLQNAPKLGKLKGGLSREDLYEEMADDRY